MPLEAGWNRSLRGNRLPIEAVVKTRDEMIRAVRFPISLERQALHRARVVAMK